MDKKRGKLSSIELLPERAWPHVKDAIAALADNKRTQESIREEFNLHLTSLDIAPVSKSAFNRQSLKLAKVGGEMAAARETAAAFIQHMGSMPDGDIGIMTQEMCKLIIYNMVGDIKAMDLETSAKILKEITLSSYRLEQAGAISSKKRQSYIDHAKVEASEAVKTVAKAKGLSGDVVNTILNEILGKPEDKPSA